MLVEETTDGQQQYHTNQGYHYYQPSLDHKVGGVGGGWSCNQESRWCRVVTGMEWEEAVTLTLKVQKNITIYIHTYTYTIQ